MNACLICFGLLSLVGCVWSFRIAAFNIQVYGQSKSGKPEVMETLSKIIQEFDIVLVQEIRDSSGKAIIALLNLINSIPGGHQYTMDISERLGRTSSKEQYAYIYRTDEQISLIGSYQHEDLLDMFERPPYTVRFSVPNTEAKEFTLIGIHVSPSKAVGEICNLTTVHAEALNLWDDNVIIMGDFNADCSYVSASKWPLITLHDEDKYYWPLDSDTDSTVAVSSCAYDRFVITGDTLIGGIVPDSVKIDRFDITYSLDPTQTKDVSDHYPIVLDLIETDAEPAPKTCSCCCTC